MKDYQTYFLMKAEDVCDYVLATLDFFEKGSELTASEIGDGNMNYVFKVEDKCSHKSLIVKQAGETLRITDAIHLSTDRGRIEAEILTLQNQFAKGLVPYVYRYDPKMCTIIMEDMTNHSMMRTALLDYKIFPHFTENITTFLANTLWQTSDLLMNPKEKKGFVKRVINPDLCELTEEYVFTIPYDRNHPTNAIFPILSEFVEREVFSDEVLHLEVNKLKNEFQNNAQSLIHGDLHTGSIFINQDHLFAFDPEFGCYGPMGYDVGNIIANMGFALMHGLMTIKDKAQRDTFTNWVYSTIQEIPDKFMEKVRVLHFDLVKDPSLKNDAFFDWYLGNVMAYTAGTCGLETMRRVIGIAKVKDITSIENEVDRAYVEKALIIYAKKCIKSRDQFKSGKDYLDAINKAMELAKDGGV